jgi:hypothetical protein
MCMRGRDELRNPPRCKSVDASRNSLDKREKLLYEYGWIHDSGAPIGGRTPQTNPF